MARSKETKIELTAYDDLFETDQSREEAKLSKIRDIPISEIDEFPDHPFKVFIDEDMEQLVDSIKRNGVMTPATVRLKEDGRYELISGHRRKKACELAGLETLKCEVKDLSRDEAIIVMVESNLQRSTILPSEKAFAYKMRLEAMKRQAGRPPKENASPLATNLPKGRSDEELGELVGESKDQIRRYIRLTELVPEILQMVDDRQIAFRPAVEISYLLEEQQYTLLEAMEYSDASTSQNMAKIFIVLSLVIILLIAPVFSGEYGGVDNIILTSKYGKTKCATAKVLASLLSAVFITTLVVIFNLLIAVAIYGTEGLDCSILFAPIDFLEGYIPFNITCGTVLKYQILLAFMSAISVTGIVLILSAVCKSQMIAFVISAAIHVIPIMLPISETSALYRIIVLMPLFYSQYISIMSVEQMHNGMLYAVWSIPVAIALVVIGSIISHKAFSKHQVR